MQSLPTPAESPSLEPKDTVNSSGSRKRQRTASMQSDASSSSAKRSLSGGPTHDNGTHLDESDATITDIDAYMTEQGEADIPATIQLPEPASLQNDAQRSMPPATKFTTVKQLRDKPMQIGETWYIVARNWYRRWEKACTGEVDKQGGLSENELGHVDNSSLLDKDGNVTSSLAEGVDVEFLTADVWVLFVQWYGEPVHPLPRKVIAKGLFQTPTLELRPPSLQVLELRSSDTSDITGSPPKHVTVSVNDTVRHLCNTLAASMSINKSPVARIWKLVSQSYEGSLYPSNRLAEDKAEILSPSDETIEDAMIEPGDAFVVEFYRDGSWLVDPVHLPETVQGPPPLFSSGSDFFTKLSAKKPENAPISLKFASSQASKSTNTYGKHFGSGNTGTQKAQEPGTLGLGNMGNTCFMNSALQCLAHNKELTEYFITGVYKEELNPDNPLGMHGAIAETFGALLHRIWAPTATTSSYSPREFKQQLQRFAPQFSGYQQHDSQELVAFLLDGLHEDLNRVLKKPYVEKPDWEGGGDREMVALAQKSWDGYMLRNDSVIVDLFQGQYKSTLVCPECQKVSITFDPFMYLTLPLPMHKKWKHDIHYIPYDPTKPHLKIPVEIGVDASFRDLRQMLGRWVGVPPDNLMTMEIFSGKFYKNLDDNVTCGEMQTNDNIICYELPCHSRQSRNRKKSDDDPFIIPIYLADVQPSRYKQHQSFYGYPLFVVIDQKQATSFDAMYDAVIMRLERWSVNSRDLYTWEAGSKSPADNPVQIVTGQRLSFDGPITEIKENGDVVTVQDEVPEEGDIVDEKDVVIREVDLDMDTDTTLDGPPKVTGTKKDIFQLQLQGNFKEYGTNYGISSARMEPWTERVDAAEKHPVLLRENDGFYCEFDENMKAYYFGDDSNRWEHARWNAWEPFVHPEYTEAKKANSERKNKGMTLEDCLAEFTKEEQLGDDDLWYCPQCKKHQHATKKFDLWKAPDVLVVHLKRFSNTRAMRDKIDTLVEFPVHGLDIGHMVGERLIAEKLIAAGANPADLNLGDLDEPLIYDLFAVDEHMGGLGGGHYRAYAVNHLTEQWYHFDDAYVTKARAEDAITANAYLLFYKRRSQHPLGGKTHTKIEEARLKQPQTSSSPPPDVETQLATPPDEPDYGPPSQHSFDPTPPPIISTSDSWPTSLSNSRSSPASTPPPLDDQAHPDAHALSFQDDDEDDDDDELQGIPIGNMMNLWQKRVTRSGGFRFPNPPSKGSPSSSNEAEPDMDELMTFEVEVEHADNDGMDWGSFSIEKDSDGTGGSEEAAEISRSRRPVRPNLENAIEQSKLDGDAQ